MPWANLHIERLQQGETVRCRPHGNSMRPRIKSGQLITLEPCTEDPPVGSAVLCKVKGNQYVHLVKAIKGHDSKRRFLIGNNHGGTNGWIGRGAIYGIVTKVGE